MALTKADMADHLFEELGLNKLTYDKPRVSSPSPDQGGETSLHRGNDDERFP
jgi:hypothetical protein